MKLLLNLLVQTVSFVVFDNSKNILPAHEKITTFQGANLSKHGAKIN
jgi:hypothetical protein